MLETAADDEGLLRPGDVYFSGDAAEPTGQGRRLPVTVYSGGWRPVEHWGLWASGRDARIEALTSLPGASKLMVAMRLQAPPGSDDPRCIAEIGGVESAPQKLTQASRWIFFDGETTPAGVLAIALRAVGVYGRPDPREIYVGMQGLAFCVAGDAAARERLQRKLGVGAARRASQAFSRVARALRLGRGGRPGVAKAAFVEAPEPRPSNPTPSSAEDPWDLAPELAARPIDELHHHHREEIDVRQLGAEERTPWGWLPTLRGVESLRGFCISRNPIVTAEIAINGFILFRGPAPGFDLVREIDKRVRKYVFNVWYDFSDTPCGRYEMELRFLDAANGLQTLRRQIVIAPPRPADLHNSSDRFVALPADRAGSVEDAVNALPSMVRPARRAFFQTPIRNVLVMRPDQLGDMVCSLPALRRLRQILPEARIVGLLSAANEGLARSLNLFDEILVVDFPDDPVQRVRVMPLERQLELKQKLAPYHFDLAIDMSDSGVSRPALFLAGARYTFGFRPGEFRWLSSAFEGVTRDPLNGLECSPHTTKVMGMMEWLGAISRSHAEIVVRDDLNRDMLAQFGIGENDSYVVLHTGARLKFSRWPHYGKLAELILARAGHKVVMMADEPEYRANLSTALLASPRFQLIDRRLSFDQFDALLSFCAGFVGNDSGPKHLASLRGANVVAIHVARNNWNEWGHENKGFIVSRRVPCAGCSLHHDPEECGKDFACIANIGTEEVYGALMRAMRGET